MKLRIKVPRETGGLPERLRRQVAQHNWNAFGFALLALFVAAFLWVALYGALFSITMLAVTVVDGTEAAMPSGFYVAFAALAIALMGAAWFDRVITVDDRPVDRNPPFEIFMDLLLAIPRATFAVWGNLSAWQWLSRLELFLAADLVERVAREKRVPLLSVPRDIPDDETRERIIFALLILRVLDIRHEDSAPAGCASPPSSPTGRLVKGPVHQARSF